MAAPPSLSRRRSSSSCFSISLLFVLFSLLAVSASGKKKDWEHNQQCDCTSQCEAMTKDLQSKLDSSTSELMTYKGTVRDLEAKMGSITAEKGDLNAQLDTVKADLEAAKAAAASQDDAIIKAEEKCRTDLAESVSKQNEALQSERSVRDDLARVEKGAEEREAALKKKLAELTKNVDSSQDQVKHMSDKYGETRRELIDAQNELRALHKKLTSKYVNTTLMYEDGWWLAERTAFKTKETTNWLLVLLNDLWTTSKDAVAAAIEVMKPVLSDLADEFNDKYDQAKIAAGPHIRSITTAVNNLVGPHVDKVKTMTKKLYGDHAKSIVEGTVLPLHEKHVAPLFQKAGEAVESVRLSAVSAVKQSSNSLIDFINDNKEHGTTAPMRERAIDHLHWTNDSAEVIVRSASYLGGALVALWLLGGFSGAFRWVVFVVKAITSPLWFPFWLIYWVFSKAVGGKGRADAAAAPQKANGKANGH